MRDGDTGQAGRTQSPADRSGGPKTTRRGVRALRPSVPGAGGWSPGGGAAQSGERMGWAGAGGRGTVAAALLGPLGSSEGVRVPGESIAETFSVPGI